MASRTILAVDDGKIITAAYWHWGGDPSFYGKRLLKMNDLKAIHFVNIGHREGFETRYDDGRFADGEVMEFPSKTDWLSLEGLFEEKIERGPIEMMYLYSIPDQRWFYVDFNFSVIYHDLRKAMDLFDEGWETADESDADRVCEISWHDIVGPERDKERISMQIETDNLLLAQPIGMDISKPEDVTHTFPVLMKEIESGRITFRCPMEGNDYRWTEFSLVKQGGGIRRVIGDGI